ncbi:3-oxoacyl-[acyl-carrier-protein] reductase FabG [Thalassoglobus neptunius]|uniref:3-oxoacyl-[acyl-carrier-protein] reductase FabG n=1 Tax=Thalassoglobus neptunius TaxID=1938619 RepID=A0A5C5X0X1_9PLAN|nr:SDR family oxidoreductase [Thalassoglobus neptunius]TWT55803.1 3-oxoacyl-[acyl-carrier-protein] reductase FabG [Thalassoglobus neptunius]
MADHKVALVTGSATGVGKACVLEFARRGFHVVVNYSRSEEEAQQTVDEVQACGVDALLVQCDISDDAAVKSMIEQVSTRFGRLDVLVNNAGCTHFVEHKDLDGMTEEKWDRILDVNLKGTFFVSRAAAETLKASGDGAIVNISSVAGISGFGSSIAYCASKGAINTMTKSLAKVLAPEVRVNAVCPGPIDTRWLRDWMSAEQIEKFTSEYPIPLCSTPEDVADAVMYLALGTKMTTGQCVVMDGGRTM